MTDYADCRFDNSDDLENDSGDIDALNSILNWEEDDETAVASSVEATTEALAQREQTNRFIPQLEPIQTNNAAFNPFPPQQWNLPGMPQQGLQFFMQETPRQQSTPVANPPTPSPASQIVTQAPQSNTANKAPNKTRSSLPPMPPSTSSKTAPNTTSKENQSTTQKHIVSSSSDPDEPKKALLTPEEKAKANRDRNREHARNTRLRKKQYLENLKKSLSDLGRERDMLVSERTAAAKMMAEVTKTRTEVLMSLFALRSVYERKRELWSSVLDESGFQCILPVTPYRSFPSSEVQVSRCQRTIFGVDAMIADTASLHVMMNNLVNRERCPNGSIRFRYTLITEDSVVAGNQIMARWIMTSINAVQNGARSEVSKNGMLCCKFNSAHRIVGLELMFDVMAFMLQLKQSCGNDSFCVVPNTVQTCQRAFEEPMVMTLSERPYTIVQVNQKWEEMTGYKSNEVVGKRTCQLLHGRETDRMKLAALMESVRFKRPATVVIINYSKCGKRFRQYLTVYPLSTDSKITHYLGLTTYHRRIDDGAPVSVISSESVSSINSGTRIRRPSANNSNNGYNLERSDQIQLPEQPHKRKKSS